MSAKLQVKLLRVLQEKEFERVGESRTIRVDTPRRRRHQPVPEDEIEAGRFRDDLYYRLNVVPIYLPPLRERREDIPALARSFLERHREEHRVDAPDADAGDDRDAAGPRLAGQRPRAGELHGARRRPVRRPAADARPARPARPGRAPLEADPPRAAATCNRSSSNSSGSASRRCPTATLDERIVGGVERELIEQVLQQCGDVQVKAAQRLGINRNTLHKKVEKFRGGEAKVPVADVDEE